ncbi:hypothetical protein NC651_022668 [Populus alba x Populus x berolinensis]|nr:hypothetical protein NC651_022668 [Populus alba x Populus x berolinensis]
MLDTYMNVDICIHMMKREREYYCQESRCSRGPYTTSHPISKYHLPGCRVLINHYLSQPLNPPGKAAF